MVERTDGWEKIGIGGGVGGEIRVSGGGREGSQMKLPVFVSINHFGSRSNCFSCFGI